MHNNNSTIKCEKNHNYEETVADNINKSGNKINDTISTSMGTVNTSLTLEEKQHNYDINEECENSGDTDGDDEDDGDDDKHARKRAPKRMTRYSEYRYSNRIGNSRD